jgi:polyhydroxyalkanoate synthesis regulator phasin
MVRRTIAAASVAAGGLAALGLGATAIAGADDGASAVADDAGGGWVEDALGGLVDDGTLTQEQADAVVDTLEDARPHHHRAWRLGHRGLVHGLGGDPTVAAESLGIDEDDLRAALRDGRTIAEIAEEQGVAVEDVVDDIVAAQRERVDEAVADGRLTQEAADEILAGAEARVTARVNGERPDPEDLPELRELLPHAREWRDRWGGGS